MTRTVSLGANGFQVSDDREGMIARLLNTVLFGGQAGPPEELFAPDGEGFWIQSLGGAHRLEDRESLLPPNDTDPSLDPERVELWAVEREVRFTCMRQIVLTGDELRALFAEAQRLAAAQRP